MSPSQTIQLQALKLKATLQGSHPSIMDALVENPDNAEGLKKQFRNVCALIPVIQFDALEAFCNTLDLSKREVMNLALSDFLVRSQVIIDAVNPYEYAEEIAQAMALAQSEDK